jgi:hypothetical protein
MTIARHLFAQTVPRREVVVDGQRSKGETHKRRDVIANRKLVVMTLGTNFFYFPNQHATRASNWIVHLAARTDDL